MSIQEASLAPDQTAPAPAARGLPIGPDSVTAGGLLTIDLAAIEANWRLLAGRTVPIECAAVVKGDAYGCGLEAVTRRLVKAGCRTFFVADLIEGRRVRAVAPEVTIYVLNGLPPNAAQTFANDSLRPVINGPTELAEWDAFVATTGWRGGAALHIDTGMNRLGLSPQEAVAIASRAQLENHGITLVMSHLACADAPSNPMNDRQIRMFRELRILFRGVPASLANSPGIFLGGGAVHCDLVRPGIALYGGNPTPGQTNPMRAVVELKGRILQVREVKRGDTVGYGASFTAQRPTRIAIVAVGYADGFLRSAAADRNKSAAQALIAGKRCPLAGRVSMDMICVDVTEVPDGGARRGDFATLIGGAIGIDEQATAMGTISYELLSRLGPRLHRVYKGA
ncbi:MAG TPA: alanine racemase [Xanthobacteraceae bacterium]|jgi:alanine racemase|nr:alanine racemase [Xanthobacteraceae bacterium]